MELAGLVGILKSLRSILIVLQQISVDLAIPVMDLFPKLLVFKISLGNPIEDAVDVLAADRDLSGRIKNPIHAVDQSIEIFGRVLNLAFLCQVGPGSMR